MKSLKWQGGQVSQIGSLFVVVVVLAGFSPWGVPAVWGQSDSVSERERATADRFLQVLERRPRPGTALDRVYGFHVQNGSLDDFIESLKVPDDGEDAGQKRMILGLLQSQRGQQAAAAEAFAKAETLLEEDYAASYFLGRSLLAVGQTEKAAAAIQRAIDRKPSRAEALPIFTELGRIYGRAGQSEKALAVWESLEKMFPGDSRVGGQIANTLAEEGNVEEALKRFEKLATTARKDDEKVGFAVQAAEMKRRMGKTDECTTALEKILARLRPGSWLYSDVRNRIEEGFLKSGDYDALADYYKEKLDGSGDNLAMQVRLGRILVSARRLDEAAATLQQAAERAPDDPEVALALIDVLVSKGDIAAAADQFERLAEQDSGNPDYLLRWGQLLLDDEKQELAARREAAGKVWMKLAEDRPDDAVTLSQIADRMRAIDRKDDAISLYEKAIEVDPGSPQYREYLGEYFHQLERRDDAVSTWRSIAEGDRRNRDSLVRLAEVFGTFEESELSLEAWHEASELDLTFPQELRFAEKLRDAKKFDEAMERLSAAGEIAETPDELEQLLKERIDTYQQAGTLTDRIAEMKAADPTADNLRELAMMHSAAGQLADAAEAIAKASDLEPESIKVLLTAAEIAERQDRFSDAVTQFQTLARIDVRFQSNYLQRVADLQMRLGQVDQALETCDQLIDANPASAESYQFLARQAFRAGRDDQGITALRRAMNVAPRDNAPRKMLASTFASRYRTEEAIELYWQAMRYETDLDGRVSIIRQLAPLYDRKAEMEELIRRIGELARDDVDARGTELMVSSAHEAVKNYGEARSAIDRLLASQPRDVSLLETMVRLSDAADEVELAAEYQQRVVALSDTPENRYKLVQLQLDAELIDVKTALSERISLSGDPARLGLMIRSAVRRGDLPTAIAISEEAIRRDDSLWDVKLSLAQLLLFQDDDDVEEDESGGDDAADTQEKDEASEPSADGDDEGFPKPHQRAIALAKEIRELDLPNDARPPTAKTPTAGTSSARSASANTSPQRWSSSSYTIARTYRLGRYGSSNYGYSSTTYATVPPVSYGHGRVLASAVELIAIAKRYRGDDLKKRLLAKVKQTVELPEPDKIEDPNQIWEFRALQSIAGYMTSNGTIMPGDPKSQERARSINWRLAELDPELGASSVRSLLLGRVTAAAARRAKSEGNADEDGEEKKTKPPEPLTERQLAIVKELYEKAKAKNDAAQAGGRRTSWSYLATYQGVLADHYEQEGDEESAAEYRLVPPDENASLSELISATQFYLRLQLEDEAEKLVDRMLPSVRSETSRKSTSSSSVSGSAGSLASSGEPGNQFVERHRLKLLDAVLAQAFRGSGKSGASSRRASLSNGTLNTYVRSTTNSYYSVQVKAPLSTGLMSQPVVAELSSLMPRPKESNAPRELTVPDEVIAHLDQPPEGAPEYEKKGRAVLAAFACWWTKRPEQCYERLTTLCQEYPDDVDLQIERARLASELSQPRVALEALDSFDPLDSRMLVRKEMAAMNLASRLGDVDRAKQAAERLFGMRMDTATQLALADQLRRLGMNEKANAVLRRLRGGRSQNESTELQIAQAFLASGDQEAAAEVAYTVLRRISSGRGSSSSSSSYRQQAVSVLKSAKRLDPLIEQAKRRVQSAPRSNRARIDLAELYTAAGKKDEADALWGEIAKTKPNDPRQMIARAEALYKAKKYKEGMILYLDAFEKNPQLFSRHFYDMRRCADRLDDQDEMFLRMTKINPDSIPSYRVDELIRVGRNNKGYTDAKRKFIAHMLKSSQVSRDFYRIIDDIPEAERKKIPAIRRLIIQVICSDDAFTPTSRTWYVSSRSSGGKANGPLEEILALLKTDEEAQEKFLKAAEEAKNDPAKRPTASFLTALYHLPDPSKQGEAAETIRKLVEKPDDSKDKQPAAVTINGGLLWQGGQVIETFRNVDELPSLLVSVYKAAGRDPSVSMTDMQFSVGARLVNALKEDSQKPQARLFLLDAYKKTDHSSQNQHNPGYGDYQDIQSYQSIAETLDSLGYPIDALIIQQRMAGSPDTFSRAKRWGGNLKIETTLEAVEKLVKKVNPKTSAEYLEQMGKSLSDGDQAQAIEMMDLPLDLMLSTGSKSGILMAIESAATTDAGRKAIVDASESLAELAEQRPDDWSVTAAQMLVAFHDDSLDPSGLTETLEKRLPARAKVVEAEGKPGAQAYRPLSSLYVLYSVAAVSEDEAAKSIAEKLSDYLGAVAKTTGDPELKIAVASLQGGSDETLQQFLDAIEDEIDGKKMLSSTQIDACMNLAAAAAKQGKVSESARALKLALGNGPPLRQINTGEDAFAIVRNSNSRMEEQRGTDSALTLRLLRIIDQFSDATGVKLGAAVPKKRSEDNPAAVVSEEEWGELAETLAAIVMPEKQPGVVHVYAKRIASRTNYDNYNSQQELTPQSVAIAMGRVAELAGVSDAMMERLDRRLEIAADKKLVAAVMVDVALAARSPEHLRESLQKFSQSVDLILPEADGANTPPPQTPSITSQMQNESYVKSDTVDLMIRTLIPVLTDKEMSEADSAGKVGELFTRTAKLINSDSYTANRHREILRRIRNKVMTAAVRSGDQKTFDKVLDQEMDSAIQQFFSFDSDMQKNATRNARETLLRRLINDGMLSNATGLIRKMIETEERPVFNSDLQMLVCLKASMMPAEEQFKFLKNLTMGNDGKVMRWGGIVSYSTPPESLQAQLPRLADVKKMAVCSAEVPLADTLLLLAESAGKLGRADELAGELEQVSEKPGDDAHLAAVLVRMVSLKKGDDLAWLNRTLDVVNAELAENKPSKTDKTLAFPTLPFYVTARAIHVGIHPAKVRMLLQNLRQYATHGQYYRIGAVIARCNAAAGASFAAGAKTGSPLEHFAAVSIPQRYRPDIKQLAPIYRMDDDLGLIGASGEGLSLLMLRYPLTGEFSFTIETGDGTSSEADVSYGGINYPALGWTQKAKIATLGNAGSGTFDVPSILRAKSNREGVRVSAGETKAVCNDKDYVTVSTTQGFPWAAVTHAQQRTFRVKSIKVAGDPTIPRQVNLIDPTFRGWGSFGYSIGSPDPMLPLSKDQKNLDKIKEQRKNRQKSIESSDLKNAWFVKDGQMMFQSSKQSNVYDPGSHLQYLRPLLDGESLKFSFWWKEGQSGIYPSIGRTVLQFGKEGTLPVWQTLSSDLTSYEFKSPAQLDPKPKPVASDNIPQEDAWNEVTLKRIGEEIEVTLNGKPLITLSVAESTRPGFKRLRKSDAKIREMTLTGDWPQTLPDDLMMRSGS